MGTVEDKTIADALDREIANNCDHYINDALAKLPASQQAAIKQVLRAPGVYESIRQQAQQGISGIVPLFRMLAQQAASFAHTAAESGHVEGLSKLVVAGTAVPEAFKVPMWCIRSFPANAVVLGDGVVFAVGPDGSTGALGRFTTDFVSIYVPISHESVLIGSRSCDDEALRLDQINAASARLSLDTFFASRSTERERALAGEIGIGDPILTAEEAQRVVVDTWAELGRPRQQE